MSHDEPTKLGTLVIDCTPLASFLEDLAPGELAGKHPTREGFEEAVMEIVSNQATWGGKVGITAEDIEVLERANERIAMIDARLPAARKLVEMMRGTRAKLDHLRHRQVYEIAALVDTRAKMRSEPELIARYEKTRAYRSAVALKGVRTRRRNAKLAAALEAATTKPAEGASAAD